MAGAAQHVGGPGAQSEENLSDNRETPPALALRFLNCLLPKRLAESIAGDLEEERRSLGAGAFWFWTQTLNIAFHYIWKRIREAVISLFQNSDAVCPQTSKGDGIMETIWNDLRYGARMLLKAPVFAIVSVLTLALGIGATTAIFSVVNALLIQPLPLPNAERMFQILGTDKTGERIYMSYPDFEDMSRQARLFEGFSAFVGQSVNLTGRAEPQRVRGGFVSDTFFNVIGVQPSVGRGFTPGVDDREGAERICILQYETWQNVFGADPNFLGKSIILNNESFTVIGILPKGFRFPFDEIELWIPHHHWPVFRAAMKDGSVQKRTEGYVGPIATLKEGVTFDQARSELAGIFKNLSKQHPEAGSRSIEMTDLRTTIIGDTRQMALVLLGAVMFVLLIACTNVANLMLSRAAARQRELATRAALGAGRRRLVAQLLTETALLWIAGCAGGLLVGWWGLTLLLAAAPADLPGGIVARLDPTVFAFAFGLTALTAILFGMIPAVRFSSPNVMDAIKEGGRSGAGSGHRSRLRSALVIGQVALTLILLVGSALMLRSLQKLTTVDVGFKPENLLTMEYRLPLNKYPEPSQQWQTHKQIIERVRQLPGVQSAALIGGLPFSGNGNTVTFTIPGKPLKEDAAPRARLNTSSTDYFRTMGIPVLRGRVFNDQDRGGTPLVAVINQHIAERFWPGQDPVGQKIQLSDDGQPVDLEIIGVVGNTKQYGLDDPDIGYIYGAQAQKPGIFNTIVVRTAGDAMNMSHSVRGAVWSVDAEQPVWKIRTVESLIERSLGMPRFVMQLMSCYAILALLLAAVGIYGVMSYSVTQRTYEIGVRMALGAQKTDVMRMLLRYGLLVIGSGVILGLTGALALGRVVQSMLFQTSPSDPSTLVIGAALLAVTAMIAGYLPARRATRVDPLVSLHYE